MKKIFLANTDLIESIESDTVVNSKHGKYVIKIHFRNHTKYIYYDDDEKLNADLEVIQRMCNTKFFVFNE